MNFPCRQIAVFRAGTNNMVNSANLRASTLGASMAQPYLITVTKAKEVDKKVKTSAGAWPIWDSESHPCDPPGSGKFPFDYSKQEVEGNGNVGMRPHWSLSYA